MAENNNEKVGNCFSKLKSEPSIQNDFKVDDIKFKSEDDSSSTVSGASTVVLVKDFDSEKSNTTMKRSNKTLALLISRLPKRFSSQQVEEYIDKLCGPCELRDLKEEDDGKAVKVIFNNIPQMAAAKKTLTSETIDGVKISVTVADIDSMEQDDGPPVKRMREDPDDERPWGLDLDVWRTDPQGLYGVKPEYLSTLGVNDTLKNWVLVLNFRCGKEELREVMELAGNVLVCSVHNRRASHNANVMYSHPLEALQAISMLNGQMLYGRPITVKMLKSNAAVLPKGLSNIGPGLAKYGKPLRDVVRHYERFVKGQTCGLNENIFRTPEQQAAQEAERITDAEDGKRRAKIAMENLVAEGIDVKDMVTALKELIAELRDEEKEQLIATLNESDGDSNRDTGSSSNSNMVVIRCNSNDEISPSDSPDFGRRANNSKSLHHASLVPLPQSSSDSLSVFPSSNSLSARTTPSPSSSVPPRPGNPMRPIGTPSSSSSSYGSSRHAPHVTAPTPSGPVPRIVNNPCNQMFPPGVQRIPTPIRPVSGPMFAQSGTMPDRMGPMSGPIPSPMSGPISSPMAGPMGPRVSPMAMPGPRISPMPGPMPGPSHSHISGPMGGPSPTSVHGRMASNIQPPGNFALPGPNTHPPFGPTVQPTSGPGATVQFSNLPPSTTFAMLSDKLAQVGQLVSIQFTVPGCVVAKYAHRSHAEMCIKQFDKSRLDGNIIDVRFI